MLVLSRKAGQMVRVGDRISIIVTATSKGQVKLAIDAPPEVHVLRGELDPRDTVLRDPRTYRCAAKATAKR